jgi:PAS domain S-box-containing protein
MMSLTDITAEQIKLIEDLLKETKEMWQQIKDLEAFKENCQGILDAQKAVISQYRMAFKYLPYGIYIKNSDKKYLYCNDAYAQLLNMKTKDILGRTDQEILSQKSAEKYLASENRVWCIAEVVEEEENHLVRGEERTFHVVRKLIKGEQYERACLLGVLIDVTDRKRQEAHREQLSLEQSQQVESLTREVEQAREFAKQLEKNFRALRAGLEMQISMCNVELKRREGELQRQAEEKEKAARILLLKVSDLQNWVASTQKYLDL